MISFAAAESLSSSSSNDSINKTVVTSKHSNALEGGKQSNLQETDSFNENQKLDFIKSEIITLIETTEHADIWGMILNLESSHSKADILRQARIVSQILQRSFSVEAKKQYDRLLDELKNL